MNLNNEIRLFWWRWGDSFSPIAYAPLGYSPSRTRCYSRALSSSRSNSPQPAALVDVRFVHFSSAGGTRVGFESPLFLMSTNFFLRATSDEQRATNLWWRWGDSNPRPLACEASALPAEPHPPYFAQAIFYQSSWRNQDAIACLSLSALLMLQISPILFFL